MAIFTPKKVIDGANNSEMITSSPYANDCDSPWYPKIIIDVCQAQSLFPSYRVEDLLSRSLKDSSRTSPKTLTFCILYTVYALCKKVCM